MDKFSSVGTPVAKENGSGTWLWQHIILMWIVCCWFCRRVAILLSGLILWALLFLCYCWNYYCWICKGRRTIMWTVPSIRWRRTAWTIISAMGALGIITCLSNYWYSSKLLYSHGVLGAVLIGWNKKKKVTGYVGEDGMGMPWLHKLAELTLVWIGLANVAWGLRMARVLLVELCGEY